MAQAALRALNVITSCSSRSTAAGGAPLFVIKQDIEAQAGSL
jgi:hypothetical protein